MKRFWPDPDSDLPCYGIPEELLEGLYSDDEGLGERLLPLLAAYREQIADGYAAAADAIYNERDRLVAALSKQFPSHLCRHEDVGADWEDDWRNIVCIHLPTGQATWHIHDSELLLFRHLNMDESHWDGHTSVEKYNRLDALPTPVLTVMESVTCCAFHGITCEPPSELCCEKCTEAEHPRHPRGVLCVMEDPRYNWLGHSHPPQTDHPEGIRGCAVCADAQK